MQTLKFHLKLLEQNQSQKELTINQSLQTIDRLLNNFIYSMDINAPYEDIDITQLYIVPSNAQNVWQGKEHHIAYYEGNWKFIPPKEGMIFYVLSKKSFFYFHDATWVST